jgi:vitamin B12 transporter
VIELENQPPPDGWRASLSNQAGSFGQWNQHLGVENTLSVWSQQTRIGRWTADNDFPYRSLSGDENRMPNASVNSHYLTHDQFLQLKHHTISGHLWLQEAKRDIPPLRGQLNNDAFQEDRILRSMFQWKWTKGKWNSHAQAAFLKERIYYEQASAQLVSDASTESWVARWEGAYTPKSSSPIQLGAQFRRDQYAPSFQNESLRQRQLALWIQANQYIKENWKFTGGLRMALLDTLPAEFLPSLRIRYQDNQDWQFQWSLNRVFRMPTMNDRFWVPGGNPALSPETGWTTQAGISKSWKKGHTEHQFALDHFQLWIQNWIIWLPETNFWSPQNVAEVWSRGMESRYRFGYQKTRWSGHIDISYQWTQTTNQRTKQPNDRSLGKQLIYVPQHQGRLNASFQYGQWKLQWNQQWTGRVFTLADNSREIPGFFLSDLRLGRRFSFAPFSLDINGSIQNLWDKDYEVVVARPMPGRHFLLDVRFFFNYK